MLHFRPSKMKFVQVTSRKNGPDQPEKRCGPRTGPDADQENFEIRGPDRTRTKKILRPADRTNENFKTRGPTRTADLAVRGSLVLTMFYSETDACSSKQGTDSSAHRKSYYMTHIPFDPELSKSPWWHLKTPGDSLTLVGWTLWFIPILKFVYYIDILTHLS